MINEFDAILFFKKASLKHIIPVKEKYKRENFPDDNCNEECCLIVRKHNDINCINFMEKWYYEIEHNSYRDQLSFNYILWKTRKKVVKYKYIGIIIYKDKEEFNLIQIQTNMVKQILK